MKKRLAAFFAIAALMVAVSIPAESQGPPERVLVIFTNQMGAACVPPAVAAKMVALGLVSFIGEC